MKKDDYDKFYKKYTSIEKERSAEKEKNSTQEGAELWQDLTEFAQIFAEGKKPPEFIKPEDLRELLEKQPGTFSEFLKYSSFRKRLLRAPSDFKEKVKGSFGDAYVVILMARAQDNISRRQGSHEKSHWMKLQKAINIYIYGLNNYTVLETYAFEKTIDVSKLNTLCVNLIGYLTEVDPLPDYIKPESLQKIILRAPVTTCIFFKHLSFVKRLKGVRSTDISVQDNNKLLWDKFFLNFTKKIRETVLGSNAPITQEQLTEFRRKEILTSVNQSLKLLDAQEEEQKYEEVCAGFAKAIDLNLHSTQEYLKKHPDLFSNLVKKGLPSCLTAKLLKKLLAFMPSEVIKYMDNYQFMLRLLADEIKKANVLIAIDALYELKKDKVILANFGDINKVELLFEQWEIRLKLNRAVYALINEVIEVASQPVTQPLLKENLKEEEETVENKSAVKTPSITLEVPKGESIESKSEVKIIGYDLKDQNNLNDILDKLNDILVESTSPDQYLWINTLFNLMEKIPQQLSQSHNIEEINVYLAKRDLLKNIEERALLLQKESMADVIADREEDTSLASTAQIGLR